MTRFTPVPPRRRPDGSIDTAAHLAEGRRARAAAARRLAALAAAPGRPARRRPRAWPWPVRT